MIIKLLNQTWSLRSNPVAQKSIVAVRLTPLCAINQKLDATTPVPVAMVENSRNAVANTSDRRLTSASCCYLFHFGDRLIGQCFEFCPKINGVLHHLNHKDSHEVFFRIDPEHCASKLWKNTRVSVFFILITPVFF
jgi:hypothetical protein